MPVAACGIDSRFPNECIAMDPLHGLSWDWIRSFVAVAELGTVAAAAAHLGTNAATVSRQVGALEKQLGIELFVRSRLGMRPTMSAMQFLEPAQAMHRAMHQFGVSVAARDEGLQGLVRITASVSLASFVLPELLGALRSLQPGIRFEVIATDSHSDLLKREADVAIRLKRPVQDELIARRVATFPIGLYASAGYLARHGMPRLDPQHLTGHQFVDVAPQRPIQEGFAKMGFGQLTQRIVCTCSDHATAWQMARAGIGIASSLDVVAKRDPSMTAVLTDVQTGRFPVWLVTHKGLRQQPRLRLVVDYLAQALRSLGA
jgi:DNA-binding transcriptional LysR family regulator